MISVLKMQERHNLLDKTIGYLDEEKEALDLGHVLLIMSITIMIISFGFEILFFCLYNGPCHPFTNILKDASDKKSKYFPVLLNKYELFLFKLYL